MLDSNVVVLVSAKKSQDHEPQMRDPTTFLHFDSAPRGLQAVRVSCRPSTRLNMF